jgi:hypothetical protein
VNSTTMNAAVSAKAMASTRPLAPAVWS